MVIKNGQMLMLKGSLMFDTLTTSFWWHQWFNHRSILYGRFSRFFDSSQYNTTSYDGPLLIYVLLSKSAINSITLIF